MSNLLKVEKIGITRIVHIPRVKIKSIVLSWLPLIIPLIIAMTIILKKGLYLNGSDYTVISMGAFIIVLLIICGVMIHNYVTTYLIVFNDKQFVLEKCRFNFEQALETHLFYQIDTVTLKEDYLAILYKDYQEFEWSKYFKLEQETWLEINEYFKARMAR